MGWLLNPMIPFVLLPLAITILSWRRVQRLRNDWQEFQTWRHTIKQTHGSRNESADLDSVPGNTLPGNEPNVLQSEEPEPRHAPLDGVSPPFVIDFDQLSTISVPGVPQAMLTPPESLWWSIEYIRKYATKPYSFPLGWRITSNGRGNFIFGSFVDDIYDILLTAIKRGGKDNTLMNILLTLMGLNSADELQIVIMDGKGGLDYQGWEEKAHVWHVAVKPHEVPMTMELVSAERDDRIKWLKSSGKSRWEEVEPGQRRPLMIVVVSEIRVLMQQVGEAEVENWLGEEMSVMGGLGMRMIVGTQNSSGTSKGWRSLFEFYMAGTQPSRHEVEPNTGKTIKELREDMGVIPPSDLPDVGTAPGVFTLVHGNVARNVRTTRIDDQQRSYWLKYMPSLTTEQHSNRVAHKQRILKNLVSERERVKLEKESLKAGVYYESNPVKSSVMVQKPIPDQIDSEHNNEVAPNPGYDLKALKVLLDTKKHTELADEPLFQRAAAIEYNRLKSINAVVKELWGSATGNRHTAVRLALLKIRERQQSNSDFIADLLAA